MTKKRTLDVERVGTALKRAAAASIHGNADERAGRFVGRNSATGQFVDPPLRSNGKGSSKVTVEQVKRK